MPKQSHTISSILNSKAAQIPANKEVLDKLVGKGEKQAAKAGNRANKYGNQKAQAEGDTFDSKREAKRWQELLLRLKAGELIFLAKQVRFELNAKGSFSYQYIADFVYQEKGKTEITVEDAKGCKTREYLKKRKLMKQIYSIEIKEV